MDTALTYSQLIILNCNIICVVELKLYNSASRTIETFVPLVDNKISLYVCGITPYDASHLGHAFVFTVFDTLIRFLTLQQYEVTYVQNITDVDDDMLKKASEVGQEWQGLGDQVVGELLNDFAYLNIKSPTHMPKASSSIDKIIEIVGVLIEKGYAYEVDGNVYFDTKKYGIYGSFARLSYKQMIALSSMRGNNIKDTAKKDPLDFVLWQKSLKNEPAWKSLWGMGRPGWHIECSAMSMTYLGNKIDIHGGGADLMFPHHESEIAQTESFTGEQPFVQYWMHCGMVMYESEKMSKSLGNLVFVKDLKKNYSANAIRWLLLSNHYRKPWEYIEEDLMQAQKTIDSIERSLNTKYTIQNTQLPVSFLAALAHDFNTPKALEILVESKSEEQVAMFDMLGFTIKS